MHLVKVRADFNGLFGELLCLSHGATCIDESGAEVELRPGMIVTAFDDDSDEHGQRDDVLATGTVERSPDWLNATGRNGSYASMSTVSGTNPTSRRACRGVLPNKRLKLSGGDRSKGSGALCAGAQELSFNYTAPCWRVARSLSASR